MKFWIIILVLMFGLTGCAQYGYIESVESVANPDHAMVGINQGGDVLFREMNRCVNGYPIKHGYEVKFRGSRILKVDSLNKDFI